MMTRLPGWLAAARRHGANVEDELIVEGANHRADAYRAVRELVASTNRPDAICTSSARSGVCAIWAVRDAGSPHADDSAAVSQILFERVLATEPVPEREITTPWVFINRGSA